MRQRIAELIRGAVLRFGIAGDRNEPALLLIRRASSVAVVSATGTILALLMQLLLARLLGIGPYGVYSIAIAWIAIALIPSKVGFDTSTVRFVARYQSEGDDDSVRAALSFARSIVIGIGLITGLLVAVWLSAVQDQLDLVAAALVFVLLPLCAYSEISAAALRGLNRVTDSLLGDSIIRPGAVLLLVPIVYFVSGSVSTNWALSIYAVGTFASVVWAIHRLSEHGIPTGGPAADKRTRVMWLKTSIPLMFANGFLVVMYSLDTVMLGALRDSQAAGLYSVCSRMAVLVLFAMNAAQTVAAPMIAAAGREPTQPALRSLIRTFNVIACSIALPSAIFASIFASNLLGLFGDEYRVGAEILRILVIMQVINVFTGPVGTLLGMLGLQRALAYLIAAGLLVNLVLNLVWIPKFGVTGAAWSSLVAHSLWNIAGVWFIRYRFGIDCTAFSILSWRVPRRIQ
ncbi:MAG: oligosaccharide flippase family protein [Steroidobacteraceae bacterium]